MDIVLLGLAAATCTTLSFLPQAIRTIQTKDVGGISLRMYVVLVIGLILWLIYGLLLGNIPIIVANGVTLLFAGFILMLVLKYRKK